MYVVGTLVPWFRGALTWFYYLKSSKDNCGDSLGVFKVKCYVTYPANGPYDDRRALNERLRIEGTSGLPTTISTSCIHFLSSLIIFYKAHCKTEEPINVSDLANSEYRPIYVIDRATPHGLTLQTMTFGTEIDFPRFSGYYVSVTIDTILIKKYYWSGGA